MPKRRQPLLVWYTVMLGVMTCGASGSIGAGVQPGSDAAYRAGTGLLSRGLHELAAGEFEKFLRDNPGHDKSATAHYALGVCFTQMGRHDDAAASLERVVGVKGFEFAPDALLLRGQCAAAMGENEAAMKWYERVVKEHADTAPAEPAALMLGEAQYRAGQLKASQDVLERFVVRWPKSESRPRAELFLALCEAGRNEYAAASARLRSLRELAPAGPYAAQATLIEAQCRSRIGERTAALALYEAAAQSAETSVAAEALLGVGQLRREAGDRRGAVIALDQLLDRHASHSAAHLGRIERARVYLEEKQPRDAKKLLDVQTGGFPESLRDDAAFWAARCEAESGEHLAAVTRLSRAILEFPISPLAPDMRYDLAGELLAVEQPDRAIDEYTKLRRDYPTHPLSLDSLSVIASVEYRRGAYEKAAGACREYLSHAVQKETGAGMELTLAESQYLLGQYASAEQAYAGFIARHPAHTQGPHAVARRGLSLMKLERVNEAEPLLLQAVGAESDGLMPEVRRAVIGALADTCFAQSRWEEAAKWLSDLVRVNGSDAAELEVPLLKLGLVQQRMGKPDEAAASFARFIEQCGESAYVPQARFELGQALYAMGKLDDAKEVFEAVLRVSPPAEEGERSKPGTAVGVVQEDYRVHSARYLAAIATKHGRSADAAAMYEQAAALADDPLLAGELVLEQGAAALSAGAYENAERALGGFVESNLDHPRAMEARGLRGIALSRLGEPEKALVELDSVLSHGASLPAAMRDSIAYERAWTLSVLGRADDAVTACTELLLRQPGEAIAAHTRIELARLYVAGKKYDEALRVLDELKANDADDAVSVMAGQAMYLRGVCEVRLGRFARAASTLDRFVSEYPVSPSHITAAMLLAEAYLKSNKPQDAAERLRRVVAASPSAEILGPALLRLGEACAAAQMWTESEEAFARFLASFEEDALAFQARFGIGWARENQGRHDVAIQAYSEVVNTHKGSTAARAQFQIGECYFAMKRHDEAVRELLKVDILFAYPEWSAAALYEAGRCFHDLDKRDDAKRQFEQVVKRYPDTNWALLSRERLQAYVPAPLPGAGRSSQEGARK